MVIENSKTENSYGFEVNSWDATISSTVFACKG